jgi:HK97 family phage prohead protease
LDQHGDISQPGAFTATLDAFVRDGWLDLNHSNLSVGTIESATQDHVGLLVRARFHGTAAGQAARTVAAERLVRGKTVSASIGFRTLSESFEQRAGKTVRLLHELELFEVSLVNRAANPLARAL